MSKGNNAGSVGYPMGKNLKIVPTDAIHITNSRWVIYMNMKGLRIKLPDDNMKIAPWP